MSNPLPNSLLRVVIESSLGHPLQPWVMAQRSAGTSWVDIATQITDKTGMRVSKETIRQWFLADDNARRETAKDAA